MTKNEQVQVRKAVLKTLVAADRPMLPQEIAGQIGVDGREVWRALDYLVFIGLVSERGFANGYTVYQVVRK